jgi:hypothetical protein
LGVIIEKGERFMDISREETLGKFDIELQKILAACQKQLELFEETELQNVDQIKPEVRKAQQVAKEQIDKQIKDLADWLHSEYRKNSINDDDLFIRLEGLLALGHIEINKRSFPKERTSEAIERFKEVVKACQCKTGEELDIKFDDVIKSLRDLGVKREVVSDDTLRTSWRGAISPLSVPNQESEESTFKQ